MYSSENTSMSDTQCKALVPDCRYRYNGKLVKLSTSVVQYVGHSHHISLFEASFTWHSQVKRPDQSKVTSSTSPKISMTITSEQTRPVHGHTRVLTHPSPELKFKWYRAFKFNSWHVFVIKCSLHISFIGKAGIEKFERL